MTKHTCHALGCDAVVRPQRLMCLKHWRMVPAAMQRAVWRHYRVGQCDSGPIAPTRAWLRAAKIAITEVAARECLPWLYEEEDEKKEKKSNDEEQDEA